MKRSNLSLLVKAIGICSVVIFIILSSILFNSSDLLLSIKKLINTPLLLAVMFVVYGLSFILRSLAWKWYVNDKVTLITCMQGIFLSLFVNHVVPFKVGDVVRIGVMAKKEKLIRLDEVLHSVVVLRIIDMAILMSISGFGFIIILKSFPLQQSIFFYGAVFFMVTIIAVVFIRKFANLVRRHIALLKNALKGWKGLLIISTVLLSWICEGIVVYGVALLYQGNFAFLHSVWVNSLTVGGQVFQVTPGGLATYETVMTFAITSIKNITMKEAYEIAIISHAFKFIFSYIVGIITIIFTPISVSSIITWIKRKGGYSS
ncbi:lysylphosphatidylglycerol synthase transmembrane domain-containing protein [Cytobacillus sp. IB215665]|uniref:lysylphosphatidylglycerol synthase transmembrane domain-containing protein n=1 Tax=Cytobacillus sp. IB215665 TaxID=3097357 RepID=UPI002A0C6CFA|nr:lysylphosphatidylglycerol synthase transmembrane domain-containing protein [Cytobacillus sp. IB215665]MDX8364000.1 lysylphosphatidylglycerol synthase transmembrane domain-containing protein [Cytobacillus sp. IB215665]